MYESYKKNPFFSSNRKKQSAFLMTTSSNKEPELQCDIIQEPKRLPDRCLNIFDGPIFITQRLTKNHIFIFEHY